LKRHREAFRAVKEFILSRCTVMALSKNLSPLKYKEMVTGTFTLSAQKALATFIKNLQTSSVDDVLFIDNHNDNNNNYHFI